MAQEITAAELVAGDVIEAVGGRQVRDGQGITVERVHRARSGDGQVECSHGYTFVLEADAKVTIQEGA